VIAGALVYFTIFYSMNKDENISMKMFTLKELAEYFSKWSSIRIFINIQVKTFIQIIYIFIPVLLIIFLQFDRLKKISRRREVIFVLFTFGIVIFLTLINWAVSHFFMGAAQIFATTSIMLMNVSAIFLV